MTILSSFPCIYFTIKPAQSLLFSGVLRAAVNTIYDGKRTYYHILKQLGEYEAPPRTIIKKIRDSAYSKAILEVVHIDNVQTAANVARIIYNFESIQQFNHKEGTCYEYTRLLMKSMFGSKKDEGGTIGQIMEKKWCRLDRTTNTYIPMDEILWKRWKEQLRKAYTGIEETKLEILGDMDNGTLKKDEGIRLLGDLNFQTFLDAKTTFKNEYGFTPVMVNVYGFKNEDYYIFSTKEAS